MQAAIICLTYAWCVAPEEHGLHGWVHCLENPFFLSLYNKREKDKHAVLFHNY